MVEDYITDDEEAFLKLMKEDEPFLKEDGSVDLEFEPLIENLDVTNEFEELVLEFEAYRKQKPKYPLDHLILCGRCGYKATVGFRQIFCPRCKEHLIRPEDAEKTDWPVRVRPKGCC